jgi:hypothetical protein
MRAGGWLRWLGGVADQGTPTNLVMSRGGKVPPVVITSIESSGWWRGVVEIEILRQWV